MLITDHPLFVLRFTTMKLFVVLAAFSVASCLANELGRGFGDEYDWFKLEEGLAEVWLLLHCKCALASAHTPSPVLCAFPCAACSSLCVSLFWISPLFPRNGLTHSLSNTPVLSGQGNRQAWHDGCSQVLVRCLQASWAQL